MKNKVTIKILIIILIIQIITPMNIMAVQQDCEIISISESVGNEIEEKSIFGSDITYSWEFVHAKDKGYSYNYVLLTPSNASEFSSLPVIVWLHGADATMENEGVSITQDGLARILLDKNIGLDRFSAYIVCPQITNIQGQWNPDSMEVFLNKFKKDYNVDTDNIIITGHSLGGNSAVMLAAALPDYFSKAVIFSSSYVAGISIPTIWYVGKYEDTVYTSAANRYDALKPIKDVHWVESMHAATNVAYELDDGKFVRYC